MTSILRRKAFTTSRLAEFCSPSELAKQTGHSLEEWPLVILKELVDNALDATEEAGLAPIITITVDNEGITIADNGPGIAPETVAAMLDYTTRTSSREAYVSPTRGAQGNALKTIVAMGYAVDGERGETVIESRGLRHSIIFSVDPIRREPRINHRQELSVVNSGLRLSVCWPDCASSILDGARRRFLQIVSHYVWTNPHLTISVNWVRGDEKEHIQHHSPATDPDWGKWSPSDPTSAHWYGVDQLARLIGAKIAHAEDNGQACPTVREFVSEFRGLKATAKGRTICEAVSASRQTLSEFYKEGSFQAVVALLDAMKSESSPVKPRDLGEIGRDHITAMVECSGAAPESIVFKRIEIEDAGVPYLVEAAFGFCPTKVARSIIMGLNWSVSIGSNPFRSLGRWGLDGILAEQHAGEEEPVVFFLHLTSPRLEYLDRGKSSVKLPVSVDNHIVDLVKSITAKWCKQRKAEERNASAIQRRNDAMMRVRSITIKKAATMVMEAAYMKASANDTLPANARQVYYAARPMILAMVGKEVLSAQYFCQTLMVDYVEENNLDWDIVWDDRGHFIEPHTERRIGLGTLAVRDYLSRIHDTRCVEGHFSSARIQTCGPHGRYRAVLFIEKEGFLPILERVKLAQRYDLAIMSSKGMSVTAARMLADRICAKYEIPLLTLHDFDRAGFSIGETIGTNTRRYTFENKIDVINLGLRLEDVERMGLDSEPAPIGSADPETIRNRLRINGASEDEIEFLVDRQQRVELNAMTSDLFIDFVESKLKAHRITKIIPTADELTAAYAVFRRGELASQIVEEILARSTLTDIEAPANLDEQLREYLNANPATPWDEALATIVKSTMVSGAQNG